MLPGMRVQFRSGGTFVAAEAESPVVLVAGELAWSVVMVGAAPVLTPIARDSVPQVPPTDYAPQTLPPAAPNPATPSLPPVKGAIDSTGVPFDPAIHEESLTLDGRWKKKRGRWGLMARGGESARVGKPPAPRPELEPQTVVVAAESVTAVTKAARPPTKPAPVRVAREVGLKSSSAPQDGGGAGWWYWAGSRGKGHYFVYNPGRSLCRKIDLHRGGLMVTFKGADLGENACPDCVLELQKRKEKAEEA